MNADGSPVAGRRILIVEDDFLIRLTLSEVLADEGFEVFEAESGDGAVVILDANPDIAVLLTDVQLPGTLDGWALVRQVRKTRPDLPVIYMTGRPEAVEGDGGSNAMFVAKPYLALGNLRRRAQDARNLIAAQKSRSA